MNNKHQLIDTRSATLECVSGELIEVRFKPDVKLDVEGMGEILQAKRKMGAGRELNVLAIMPPELDFELNVLSTDHQALNGGCGLSGRMAFATQSTFNERLTNLYFRYHPRERPTGIFVSEADARKWLATNLPEPSAS